MALIMDVRLAYSGVDLLKLIRSEAQQVSTRWCDIWRRSTRTCLTAGADAFYLKPYAPTELISAADAITAK